MTRPSGSARLILTFLYSLPVTVLMSSARAKVRAAANNSVASAPTRLFIELEVKHGTRTTCKTFPLAEKFEFADLPERPPEKFVQGNVFAKRSVCENLFRNERANNPSAAITKFAMAEARRLGSFRGRRRQS